MSIITSIFQLTHADLFLFWLTYRPNACFDQALESWDLESCIKSLDLVEASIRSAAQDSSSATRSHGRNMFGAYASALPQRAQAFLRRMDSSLQEKLNQALQQYVPGKGPHQLCFFLRKLWLRVRPRIH